MEGTVRKLYESFADRRSLISTVEESSNLLQQKRKSWQILPNPAWYGKYYLIVQTGESCQKGKSTKSNTTIDYGPGSNPGIDIFRAEILDV